MPDTPKAAKPRDGLGIVGAGEIGTAVARAAIDAGYDVLISGSGSIDRIALTVEILAPGARTTTTDQVAAAADLIVLALPIHRFRELPRDLFDGKTLIDAMNYWQPIDGEDNELAHAPSGTSALVQSHFPGANVVKALNQLGYREFDQQRHPAGHPDRVALAAAGDDPDARAGVLRLVDRLGFGPVDAGPLHAGRLLGPGGPAFGAALSAPDLRCEFKRAAYTLDSAP